MVLAESLRQAVLQAALQGKLTEQLEADSDVDEMLVNIHLKKERLIANKKIKKEKLLSKIQEENPFDIPKNWRWVRMQNLLNIRSAVRVHQSDWQAAGVPFFRAREIVTLDRDGYVNNDLFITEELYNKIKNESGVPARNDLMVSAVGTLGKVYVVRENDKFYYKDASVLCFENIGNQNSKYLEYALKSPIMLKQIYKDAMGTTVATLTIDRANAMLIPIPPIEEQQRIVDRINEIMPKIDEYEKIEKELEKLKRKFPDDMKDALLQAAMQGQLTEQLESDSSVDELLEANRKEKEELIAQKKIKKEKSSPEIEEGDFPFDIPPNWRWVRLNEIGEIIGGGTPKTSQAEFWENGNIAWITPADMNGSGRYIERGEKSITSAGLEHSSAKLFPKGSVIISSRAPIGYIAIAQNEASTSQGCKTFSAYLRNFISSEFIYYVMQCRVSDMEKRATGTTFKEISGKGVGETIIPLPPVEEQHRIVKRLDALLPLCEEMRQ